MTREGSFADFFAASVAQLGCHRTFSALSQICKTTLLLCATMTLIVFTAGLLAGATLDLLLLRTLQHALLDWTRFIPGLPLGLIGLFITVCGYFNLGLGNTYCGADGLVTGGLYRFSRNPQYTASIIGLVGLSIGANSLLTIALSTVMVGAYVMMALVEEDWLKQLYGAPYRDYCMQTARFLDLQGLLALAERRKPSRQTS
jgi:protein-S-isoprenylcysteine O-methyltransferase Ste14